MVKNNTGKVMLYEGMDEMFTELVKKCVERDQQ